MSNEYAISWLVLVLIVHFIRYFPYLFVFIGVLGTVINRRSAQTKKIYVVLTVIGLLFVGYIVLRESYRIPKQKEEYAKVASSFAYPIYLPKHIPKGYKIQNSVPYLNYARRDCFTADFVRKLPNEKYRSTISLYEELYDFQENDSPYLDKCWSNIKRDDVSQNLYEQISKTPNNLQIFTTESFFNSFSKYYAIRDKVLITVLISDKNKTGNGGSNKNHDEIIRMIDSLVEIDSSNSAQFMENRRYGATQFDWAFAGGVRY